MGLFHDQPDITADRLRRFEAKTTPAPPCDCVLWIGGVNEHGYGIFWNGKRLEKAHRFALRASGVDVPDWLDVCPHCDTPACVNAEHLFVGAAQKNVDDMWAKSRATVQKRHGTAQPQAKLDDEKVARIRELGRRGVRQRDIAAMYGVCQATIWRVVNGRGWKQSSGVVVEKGRGR